MVYSIPASPVIMDTDNDGFVDTAYVGDLGGNMWRFKFCMAADGPQCSTGNWSAGLLFQSSTGYIQPIFRAATITRDSNSLWVFWGTGDEENPNATSGPDHFFALTDNDRTTVYNIGNLQNISAQGTIYNGTSSGWYLTLPGAGEKLLSDPTVFGGIVMFNTYIPPSGSDPCVATGTSNFYGISMMQQVISGYTYSAGAGVLSPGSTGVTTGGARSVLLGTGLAQTPIVSQNLSGTGGTDLYISLSGTNIISNAQLANLGPNPGSMPLIQRLTQTAPSNQVIHWKDGRVQ